MSRQPRDLQQGYCYHITVRCNNREFKLLRHECREVFFYALNQAKEKFGFKLYEQSCSLFIETVSFF
jgi:putative transposase